MNRNEVIVALLGIVTIIAVGFVLKAAQSVVIPLIIAWLLSYIMGPAVTFLNSKRVPTPVAILLLLILFVGVCYLVGIFLYGRVNAFTAEFPKYNARLHEIVSDVTTKWNVPKDYLMEYDWGQQVGQYLVSLSGSLVGFVSNLMMVMIYLVFLLLGKPFFKYKIQHAFSSSNADRFTGVISSISGQIGKYLSIQFLVSTITGVLVWLSLSVIGVDFPVTWGALAFFLNFIPTIGSIVASIPPVVLALVQFYPTYGPAIATLIVLLSIQMVIGNGVAPKLFGDSLNLSPVVVLLSLLFWGWLWGIVGALLSIPIAAAIKIVCENVQSLKPISVLMGSGKSYAKQMRSES